MSISLGDIAVRFGCELHGDPDLEIRCVGTLAGAGNGAVSFLANSRYRPQLAATKATAVILRPADAAGCPVAALVAPDPYGVFAGVARELHPAPVPEPGIDAMAAIGAGAVVPGSCRIEAGVVIGTDVVLGERVWLEANAVIGARSVIGADTRILAGVVVCHEVEIGARCVIHPGAVIGSDGFGNARDTAGAWTKVPQVGGVVIGDDVEIGANTSVDRGAIEDTVIGPGARIDNLVQVGHNCRIGAHTAIAGMTGIAGSTRIGARCMIGGAVNFAGHLDVADDVAITGGTSVVKSIERPGVYGGIASSAEEAGKWRRNAVRFSQLDEMARRLARLERQLRKTDRDG